jgi:hypothetical protein
MERVNKQSFSDRVHYPLIFQEVAEQYRTGIGGYETGCMDLFPNILSLFCNPRYLGNEERKRSLSRLP